MYRVKLSRSAGRYLASLTGNQQLRIAARLDALALDPYSPGLSKPLHGKLEGRRASRVGDVRIVFRVVDLQLLVFVVEIGPRGDVYKQ